MNNLNDWSSTGFNREKLHQNQYNFLHELTQKMSEVNLTLQREK